MTRIELATSVLTVPEAQRAILDRIRRLPPERVAVTALAGRVTAKPVVARRDNPPWDNSAMDGYAVRSADLEGGEELPVGLDLPAGAASGQQLPEGTVARIMTGAPLPLGADAVVPVEATRGPDGVATFAGIGERVRFEEPVGRGDHVRRRGEDVASGAVAVPSGVRCSGVEVAMAIACGHAMVSVARRPRVAIVPTGDELADPGDPGGPDRIMNGNAYALAAEVARAGGDPVVLPIVPDRADATRRAVESALGADVVITIGGVSMGEYDHVRAALEDAGVEIVFWRVAIKPGGPVAFGVTAEGRPVFGLPGNPVSVLVTFELFARPGLLAMQGARRLLPGRFRARLIADVRTRPGKDHYIRVRLAHGADGWTAEPTRSQSSAVLSAMVDADGLLVVPGGIDGLPAGAEVTVHPLRDFSIPPDSEPGR